jgi:Holliday junction resolvase RusA-like endonuclease
MEQAVSFEVFGIPVPQGSKNVYRGRLVEAQGTKLKIWRAEIKRVAEQTFNQDLITGAVKLEVSFFMPRPKTVGRSVREFPHKAPDL